jgi:hypothetical protein
MGLVQHLLISRRSNLDLALSNQRNQREHSSNDCAFVLGPGSYLVIPTPQYPTSFQMLTLFVQNLHQQDGRDLGAYSSP